MVIYEVNLSINNEIYPEFRVWLKEHISEMLQFPGFIQASILKPEPNNPSDKQELTVQYQLEDRAHLEEYFTEFATTMREKGIKKFSNQFSARRRVCTVEEIIN